jgi:signal transduction histidine kinase/ligand-binding sensor domain-containing protein
MCRSFYNHLVRFGIVLVAVAWPALTFASQPGRSINVGDFLVHVWGSDEGLPQNSVTALAQPPGGYLWIGTRSGGLARFDGGRFVTFNPQNTPALQDVEIENLSVDRTGVMWIATGNENLVVLRNGQLELRRERFAEPRWHPLEAVAETSEGIWFNTPRNALHLTSLTGLPNTTRALPLEPRPRAPRRFIQMNSGEIWYPGTTGKLGWVDPADKEAPDWVKNLLQKPVQGLAQTARGELVMVMDQRLLRLVGTELTDITPPDGPALNHVQDIIPVADDGLWVWETNSLRLWRDGAWVLEARGTKPLAAARAFATRQGELWLFGDPEAVYHVDRTGTITQLSRAKGFPSTLINCWIEDEDGNLWLGSRDAGLIRIRPRQFRVYGQEEGLPEEMVVSVCQDRDGTLWAGTGQGGLARLGDDRFETLIKPRIHGDWLQGVVVFPHRDGGIWVSAAQGNIGRWTDSQLLNPFGSGRSPVRFPSVLHQDRRGRLWMGTGRGLQRFDGSETVRFDAASGFVGGTGVRALAEDNTGAIWIGTGPGTLWRFAEEKFQRIPTPTNWPTARIAALYADPEGIVWVGTLGGGLWRYADGVLGRVTKANGLPDDSVTQLLEDDDGQLWGGTYSGLFRAPKADLARVARGESQRLTCAIYGRSDGLPSTEFHGWNQPACWRTMDGQLWFSTVKGLLAVTPDQIISNPRPPPVVIEEMHVDGQPWTLPPHQAGAEALVRLEPGRHTVEFHFTALSFVAPDKLRFRWKLEGADNAWREEINRRLVSYGPLPPGEYRLRVQAANNDGVWNEAGDQLAFRIPPHFWETIWFRLLLVATGFAALVLGLSHRHKLSLERIQRRHEMERERIRIAQDLHDDLGARLTQISLLSSLAGREQTPVGEAKQLVFQVRDTCRDMVAALNEIVWAVNPRNDSCHELVGYLGHFAEQFLRAAGIRCRLEIPHKLPHIPLSPEIRHHVFLAFKEAVNNAVKHAGASEVQIEARLATNQLIVSVADNGRGFAIAPGIPPEGNGLANMRQRMQKLGGLCEIHSTPGKGSTVRFELPLT